MYMMLFMLASEAPGLAWAPLALAGSHMSSLQGTCSTEPSQQYQIAYDLYHVMLCDPQSSGLDIVAWKEVMLLAVFFFCMVFKSTAFRNRRVNKQFFYFSIISSKRTETGWWQVFPWRWTWYYTLYLSWTGSIL